jgi:hypothetical protein
MPKSEALEEPGGGLILGMVPGEKRFDPEPSEGVVHDGGCGFRPIPLPPVFEKEVKAKLESVVARVGAQPAAPEVDVILEPEDGPILKSGRLLGEDLELEALSNLLLGEGTADESAHPGVPPKCHGQAEIGGGPDAEADPL